MGADSKLAERYWDILQEYLDRNDEVLLNRGYEFARRAMVDGCGVLEMAGAHHLALRRLREESRLDDQLLKLAGNFFAECLSPFEMSHRGALEGTRALRHLNAVLEEEVKRIAHALHDEAGQLLASVSIAVADVASEMPPSTRTRFLEIDRFLKQIEVELRNLSHDLRPTVLDNLGLIPALEFLADRVAKRTGLSVFVTGDASTRLPAEIETALYRIVQESVSNAVKHAHANLVRIELQRTPSKVACTVCDDGKGFDANRQHGARGLGLNGIRERLNALGGSLKLTTEPRCGTTIQVEIPLGGGHARYPG